MDDLQTIKIHDKVFVKTITREDIDREVKKVAEMINRDYAGKRPLLLGVLNGSFMFVADLMKHLDIECEISFVKLSSYQGTATTGVIREVIGLSEDIAGRDVIVIEDIVDTGITMQRMLETLGERNPASVAIASLFLKPARLKVPVDVKYSAFTIPDRFIVGYGLDYDGLGRNLPDVYDVVEQ
jgi:hypoxanthine phosphoribosyltransferase